MLMATPETMWSTPKVTVARACSSPPSAPPTTPASTAAHGPYCQPAQPAANVPSIIMPSRPMLTTPARSAHRPPSPASPMGTAALSAEENWLLLVRSLAPVSTRMREKRTSPPASSRRTTG